MKNGMLQIVVVRDILTAIIKSILDLPDGITLRNHFPKDFPGMASFCVQIFPPLLYRQYNAKNAACSTRFMIGLANWKHSGQKVELSR